MAVGLQLAGRNEFVKVQENINDNLTKLDEAIDFNLLATLGIEYGGILNNTDAKVAGKAYYDTTGKKLFKCIANTSINYADAEFFEAISNNDLLSLVSTTNLKGVTYKKYSDGTMTAEGSVTFSIPTPNSGIVSNWITFDIPFVDNKYIPIISGHGGSTSLSNVSVAIANPVSFANDKFSVYGMRVRMDVPFESAYIITFFVTGKYKSRRQI